MLKIKEMAEFLLETLKLAIWLVTIIFFGYFITAEIFSSLVPELSKKETLISRLSSSDFNFIVLLTLIPLFFVFFIDAKRKKIKHGYSYFSSDREIIVFFLISYFLGFFIIHSMTVPLILQKPSVVVVTAVLFFFLPSAVLFYENYDFEYFRKLFRSIHPRRMIDAFSAFLWSVKQKKPKVDWEKLAVSVRQLIFVFALFVFFIFFLFVTVSFITLKINVYLNRQKRIRDSFIITEIRPKASTNGEKVILSGHNFKFRWNDKFSINSNYGLINDIQLWDETKVEFIVPLHVNPGKMKVWLERTKEESSQSALMKSNKIELTIMPRWDFYPKESDYKYPPTFWSSMTIIKKKIKRYLLLR